MVADESDFYKNDKLSKVDRSINSKVFFSHGRVAELLRRLESFLGIPLSLRSTTGEVVCKTDYFQGPCSIIRGTDVGCKRCRKVYKNIENRVLRRKVPFVCLCYCGFLIFAVPLEFRGEMLGILFGSQIIPVSGEGSISDFRMQFEGCSKGLGIDLNDEFYDLFDRVKTLDSDKQRVKFLSYMEEIGRHFVEMAVADKPWKTFIEEIKAKTPEFGKF